MAVWKPKDWGSHFLWLSLSRSGDEDSRSWARTREVWGAEGEEGLAYPEAPRLLLCRDTSFPHSQPLLLKCCTGRP